jgi:hypothetical protein
MLELRGHQTVTGGWWLVAGGWWLVAGGWWLVAGKKTDPAGAAREKKWICNLPA